MGEDDAVKTVVGVVAHVRASLHDNPAPHAYYPYCSGVPGDVVMVVRTRAGPDAAAAPIRTALRSADPQLPIAPIRARQDVINSVVEQRRFQSTLVAVFAASALLVAGLGILRRESRTRWRAVATKSASAWRSAPSGGNALRFEERI
jgi:hypothetical protein